MKALEKIDENPDLLVQLRERSINLHKSILQSQLTEQFTLKSDLSSPLKHLYLKDQTLSFTEQQFKLQNIVDYVSYFSLVIFSFIFTCDNQIEVQPKKEVT